MPGIARRSDPALWDAVKAEITQGAKGGKPGQWSARKAQLATAEYQRRGGAYLGPKDGDNHLAQWKREEWGTRSGRPSRETGERYLPRAAREALSDGDHARSSTAKRRDSAAGRQFPPPPAGIAARTASLRHAGKDHRGGDRMDQDIAAEFRRLVNIPAEELAEWLESEESRVAGMTREGEAEAVGHQSGRRILAILRGEAAEEAFLHEVVGYIHRHLAQRPAGEVTQTRWRHSLMNWGHDPLREEEGMGETEMQPEMEGESPPAMMPEAEPAPAPKRRRAAPRRKAAADGESSGQSEGGRKGGSARTPRKAAAARSNAAKGAATRRASSG
ncbi:DUF3140 domain-containing protein, partial [Siccirubricoccus sp. KC 17139]